MAMMMKAMRIHHFGEADAVSADEVPVPQPRADELLIRVKAASVNPVDYKIRRGQYPPVTADRLPAIQGRDLCGTVEACGTAVRAFTPGDDVYAMLQPDRGSFAEFALVKETEAAARPLALDPVQAAAVPLAALTAWQGLFDHGRLSPGQRVLIHGGAGGVGHFAVQFAKAKGATVITTVSGKDMDFVRELGADQAIDYKSDRFEKSVRDIDLVFTLVAGDVEDRSWSVLRSGGTLVSTVSDPSQSRLARSDIRALRYTAQPNAAQLAEIGRMIEAGQVRPCIAKVFPLAEAGTAEAYVEKAHVRGKVVLLAPDSGGPVLAL